MDMGVPSRAVLLNNLSWISYEHIPHLQPVLTETTHQRFLRVASATHMHCAEAVLHKAELDVTPVVTNFSAASGSVVTVRWYLLNADSLSGSINVVHEIAGHWFYQFRGWE